PHQPRGAVLSSTVRATPHPAPSRRARRALGRGPMGRDLLGDVRDEGDRAESLQRGRQLPLVPCTVPGDPAGDDLATLGHEGPEALDVAIVDGQHLVDAELADLAPAEPTPLDGLDHLFASLSLPVPAPPRAARRRGLR